MHHPALSAPLTVVIYVSGMTDRYFRYIFFLLLFAREQAIIDDIDDVSKILGTRGKIFPLSSLSVLVWVLSSHV